MLVKGPISSKLLPKKIFLFENQKFREKNQISYPPQKGLFLGGGGIFIKCRFQRFCLSMILAFLYLFVMEKRLKTHEKSGLEAFEHLICVSEKN